MKYLDSVYLSENEFGVELVLNLDSGWKEQAKNFPKERIKKILGNSMHFAQGYADKNKRQIEVTAGEFGLHHISLTPDRAGLDLFPDQNQYIGHNLNRAMVMEVLPIILDYLKVLEYVKPA